jgi:hypothetical protein
MDLYEYTYAHVPFSWRKFFNLSHIKDIVKQISDLLGKGQYAGIWNEFVRVPYQFVRAVVVMEGPHKSYADQHVLVLNSTPSGYNKRIWSPLIANVIGWINERTPNMIFVIYDPIHINRIQANLASTNSCFAVTVIYKNVPSYEINRTNGEVDRHLLRSRLPPIIWE